MIRNPESRTGVAAFRPWPFGPPLRGRAPRRNAGPLTANDLGAHLGDQPNGVLPERQALAPVGGLSWHHPVHTVQR
jgi:hypothetical protein